MVLFFVDYPAKRRGIRYKFGCVCVCVCLSIWLQYEFESLEVGSSFSHIRYIFREYK